MDRIGSASLHNTICVENAAHLTPMVSLMVEEVDEHRSPTTRLSGRISGGPACRTRCRFIDQCSLLGGGRLLPGKVRAGRRHVGPGGVE